MRSLTTDPSLLPVPLPNPEPINFRYKYLPIMGSFSVFRGFEVVDVEGGAGEEVREGGAEGATVHFCVFGDGGEVDVLTVDTISTGTFKAWKG